MPLAILAALLPTLKAGFEFGSEVMRFLATPEGQIAAARIREDQAAARKAFDTVGGWLRKLFTGQVLRFDANALKLVDK